MHLLLWFGEGNRSRFQSAQLGTGRCKGSFPPASNVPAVAGGDGITESVPDPMERGEGRGVTLD